MRHCGVVVKKFLAGADVPGSTPGDAFFFNTIFPFGLFSFILTADPADHALGSIYILSLSSEFYF